MCKVDIYREQGYGNRGEYLKGLSEDYGVEYSTVLALANLLGPEEDFDGLVTQLEDMEGNI
jgi:hypothetical protein